MKEDATDITIEVFNHCAGSCTGCLLSVQERKALGPVMQPATFEKVIEELVAYGEETRRRYRPVLVYGDVPWLPVKLQNRYYEIISKAGLPIGLTMTFVEQEKEENYARGIEAVLKNCPEAVFDITIDPIRLFKDKGYHHRLLMGMDAAPELHLQMLLSEAVLTRNTPEDLALKMSDALEGRAVSLGFTPALSRMDGTNYRYEVGSAARWAKRFYERTSEGKILLANELARFGVGADHKDFIAQTFHVGPNTSVWQTAYTLFGDVIIDERNGGKPLGRLNENKLGEILSGKSARRAAALAEASMYEGDFNCSECTHFHHCSFHGVGAVRRVYKDYETRTGSCHGPIFFEKENLVGTASAY